MYIVVISEFIYVIYHQQLIETTKSIDSKHFFNQIILTHYYLRIFNVQILNDNITLIICSSF